jgi:sarcosine oxidase
MPELRLPLRVTRQVMAWFAPPDAAAFSAERFPIFLSQTGHGIHYGFPAGANGVKVCKHFHLDEEVTPATADRTVSPRDIAAIRGFLAGHLPALDRPPAVAKTCLYTMTPDGDFILDRLPGEPNIIVASPCSGHGFKFAPVIGEILADLATAGATQHDISRFRLSRFA